MQKRGHKNRTNRRKKGVKKMNINLTTIFGFKLQLSIGYYDKANKEFTAIGINLVKTMEE